MVKVYKYGLLAPTAGAEIVAEQMDLAWRSAVARVRIETEYRERRAALERSALPTVGKIAGLTEDVERMRAALRQLRTGRKKPSTPEAILLTSEVRRVREQIKSLRPDAARERTAFRAAGELEALETWRKGKMLGAAQAFSAAGLFWGQRQLVEAAHDQRRKVWGERLRLPQGWGAVGIQIQGKLPVAEMAGDPRVQLSAPLPNPNRAGKRRDYLRLLRLRIGPNNAVGEWPIILHRPLPEDGVICHVKVTREQVGPKTRWAAHFTLDLPDPAQVVGDDSVVAVAPRFIGVADGRGLCVADIAASDGTRAAYLLHPQIVGGLRRAEDIRSIRDKARDALLPVIAEWASAGRVPEGWPKAIAQWESCNRLREFVRGWWAQHRVAGDEAIYELAVAWAYRDWHLWAYEHGASRGAIDRRTHDYRVWAATLAKQYGALKVSAHDFRQMAVRKAEPERETELSRKASRQRMMAAPGLLRSILIAAFVSRGKRVFLSPHGDADMMLRERSDAVEKVATARKAKFHKRHKVARDEVGDVLARQGVEAGPLENCGISDGTGAS